MPVRSATPSKPVPSQQELKVPAPGVWSGSFWMFVPKSRSTGQGRESLSHPLSMTGSFGSKPTRAGLRGKRACFAQGSFQCGIAFEPGGAGGFRGSSVCVSVSLCVCIYLCVYVCVSVCVSVCECV